MLTFYFLVTASYGCLCLCLPFLAYWSGRPRLRSAIPPSSTWLQIWISGALRCPCNTPDTLQKKSGLQTSTSSPTRAPTWTNPISLQKERSCPAPSSTWLQIWSSRALRCPCQTPARDQSPEGRISCWTRLHRRQDRPPGQLQLGGPVRPLNFIQLVHIEHYTQLNQKMMSFLLIYIQFFGFDISPTTGGFSLSASHNRIVKIVYLK